MAKVHNKTTAKEGVGFLVSNDLDKLVQKGIPGIIDDVKKMPDNDFRQGLLIALEVITDTFRFYIDFAEKNGRKDISATLSSLLNTAPSSLKEALQLILLFELFSHEKHYEINRLDVACGDIYAKELDNGTITQECAIDLIREFFHMINENGEPGVCRLIMGGKRRRNEKSADCFIKAVLKAEQLHKKVTPQVSIRLYKDIDPDIVSLSYDTISATHSFPLLLNDETIIPGVAEAYDVSIDEAYDYYPCGCGETILSPYSPAILVSGWNIPRIVDTAIRELHKNDPELQLDFDMLYSAFIKELKKEAKQKAEYHKLVVDINNENCAFLMSSILVSDCLERGKPVLNGGARYLGAVVMGHGYTNASDSLIAIKKVIIEDRLFTLSELINALDNNFNGFDDIHKELINAPKYGNDNEEADKMLSKLWYDVNDEAKKAGKNVGFDFFTASSVNPGGYGEGQSLGATADGRLKGQSYAIGNAPTAGADKNGLTALMNSVLKTSPTNGGTTTNFKISGDFINKERKKFESLFNAYWEDGGLQATITVVNKGELEAAMKEPEKYPNLLVRLGGWTARFVDLEPFIQKEILTRTLY